MATDDVRIRQAPELAKEAGLKYTFPQVTLTAPIQILQSYIDRCQRTAGFSSGFQYRRRKYPGNGSQWYGSFPYRTVYDSDRPSQRCSRHHCRCYRSHGRRRHQHLQFPSFQTEKGGEAVMTIELDGKPSPEINKKINTLPNIYSSTMLQPI